MFKKSVENLGDDFLRKIQKEILKDPEAADLIQGTGGIRKLRLKYGNKGKSGGYRILYFDSASKEICLLLFAYSKSGQENISVEEKLVLRRMVQIFKEEGQR